MRVAARSGSPAVPELRGRGLNVEEIAISGKANPAALFRLRRAFHDSGAELMHSHLSSASWWCGWLESVGGPPTLGHVHGFTWAEWHRRQSHLVAVSGAVKDDLVAQGIEADRITVLHNALSPEEFVPKRDPLAVRAEFGADANTPVVGSFGHLSVKKGYRDLFEAIPVVLKRNPRTQFWVIGKGKLREELENKARREGFLKSVRFTGFRNDAADLMNAVNVMALPSHREPHALVYLEAALSSKPIVACRAGGAVESIADGETGLLVPVRNGAAVADAINALLEDQALAKELGQAGRQRALEIFSWEKFTATLEGVYERMLGESATRQAA